MTASLDQLNVLVGEWITESTKYSEGRGRASVAPTEEVADGLWTMWPDAPGFNQR